MKILKACFCVPDAYSLYDTSTNYYFGGAELRSSIFGKGLSEFSDVKVNVITDDHGQSPYKTINNVSLFPNLFYRSNKRACGASAILNKFFLQYVKIIGRLKSSGQYEQFLKEYWLKKIDADCYFLFSTTKQSMEVIDFCIKKNKRFFHFIAHDSQVMPTNSEKLEKIIKYADKIFVQNTFQYESVKKLRNEKVYIINNPVQPGLVIEDGDQKKNKKILWVGKATQVKNPLLFVELCKLNPDKKFIMVCVNNSEELFQKVKNSLPKNIEFYEFLPLDKMNKIFSEVYMFVSTAGYEGFPNTFLQAASYGLPVISTNVDPNGYITKFNCGVVVKESVEELNEKLNLIFNDARLYKELSNNHYQYVLKNHDRKNIVKQLYDHLKQNN